MSSTRKNHNGHTAPQNSVQNETITPEEEEFQGAELLRVLEAVLFASDEIMSSTKLKSILPGEPDGRQIRKLVEKLNTELQNQRHPFEIVEVAGGYQFRTVSYYSPWVRQLFKEKTSRRLSIQALECLAIIAYQQPLTKAEIEAVRGVVSDGAIRTLLERHLITIAGRSDKPGRPLLYSTTKEFLSYFGLRSIKDLPTIDDFEQVAKEKMGDLANELEQMNQEKAEGSGEKEKSEENTQEETTEGTGLPDQALESNGVSEEGSSEEKPEADQELETNENHASAEHNEQSQSIESQDDSNSTSENEVEQADAQSTEKTSSPDQGSEESSVQDSPDTSEKNER